MKQAFEKLVEQHGGTVGRHVDVNELIERYPRLFHLAEAGSAPAISEHGLLPAKRLCRPQPWAPMSRPRS